MPDQLAAGFLVLDKPAGPTSFDCVRQVQRVLGQKRIGHCGTLDPLAEGVLILLLGPDTIQQSRFQALEKQYWFRGRLGLSTDTGDRHGRLLDCAPYGWINQEQLQAVADHFVGEHWQIPPRYSAVKYRGRRLYEWTREGENVPRPPRQVQIHSFEILRFQLPFWEARVVCSRGTYIRSLVEDVGRGLGTVAMVEALVRERVGSYTREQGISWTGLCNATRNDILGWSRPCPPS